MRDPNLYDRLWQILATNQRALSQVERNGILPANTLFYGTAIPVPRVPCFSARSRETQARLRAEWFDEAFKKLSRSDLVFLDPDNGLAPRRCRKHLYGSAKYIFEDEVAAFLKRGQSVVLYQHQQRRSLSEQVSEQHKLLAAGKPWQAVSFHRRAAGIYYVLPAEDHKRRISEQLTCFLAGEWGKHFRACNAEFQS